LGDLKLFANGNLLKSVTNDSTLSYSGLFNNLGTGKIKLVLEGTKGANKYYDTSYIIGKQAPNIAASPAGIQDGINYVNDNTVILQLFAPNKSYVYALGDFNNWEFDNNYLLNKTPDGNRYWIQINGLTKGKEYTFQYSIDDAQLRVADVYSDKILDPYNDQYIPAVTYPNLIKYPVGKLQRLFQCCKQVKLLLIGQPQVLQNQQTIS